MHRFQLFVQNKYSNPAFTNFLEASHTIDASDSRPTYRLLNLPNDQRASLSWVFSITQSKVSKQSQTLTLYPVWNSSQSIICVDSFS